VISYSEIKASVILPVFNKAAVLPQVLENLERILLEYSFQWKFIIVNDGSSDGFEQLKLSKSIYQVCNLEKNGGKGGAIKEGLKHCTSSNFVILFDADLDIDPECLPRMIDTIVNGRCDIAITSKLHPESNVNYPWIRKILSYGYYFFVKTLFGLNVKDTQTGAKIFNNDSIGCMQDNQQEGFVFDLESLIRAKKRRLRVEQYPVTINMIDNSTVGVEDIIKMIVATLRLKVRHNEN